MDQQELKNILELHRQWVMGEANGERADLSYANMRYSKLWQNEEIRDDLYKVLLIAKSEAIGLYDAVVRGKIDGSHYSGECACLIGTISNLRHESYKNLGIDLRPDDIRPIERWFMGIEEGDTPDSNPISAIVKEWMEEWFKKEGISFPSYRLISSLEHPELFK